jgi:hypothetical protein
MKSPDPVFYVTQDMPVSKKVLLYFISGLIHLLVGVLVRTELLVLAMIVCSALLLVVDFGDETDPAITASKVVLRAVMSIMLPMRIYTQVNPVTDGGLGFFLGLSAAALFPIAFLFLLWEQVFPKLRDFDKDTRLKFAVPRLLAPVLLLCLW